MLVLTRRISQDLNAQRNCIVITNGKDVIEVYTLCPDGPGQIKVGIQADINVWAIQRPEAVQKMRMANAPRKDFR